MKSDVQVLENEVKSMTEIINILRDENIIVLIKRIGIRTVRTQKSLKQVLHNVVNVRNLNLNCK